jgi:hypothetical protein
MKGVKKWLSSDGRLPGHMHTKTYSPNISTSISEVTMLRSSLSVCIYILYNIFFSLFVNRSPEVTFQMALIYAVPKTLQQPFSNMTAGNNFLLFFSRKK